jgi:2-polyprenyl-6-methoxyphenol hydroxylase-like FAD-dependent oxidoreductase
MMKLAAFWQQMLPIMPALPTHKYLSVNNLAFDPYHGMEEVIGSIPIRSTKQPLQYQRFTGTARPPPEPSRVLKGAEAFLEHPQHHLDHLRIGLALLLRDSSGVTVIGDAAHLMSPFAGEGANLAMYDGAELGEAIAANPGDIEAALLAYEKDLFSRSASAAAEADRNLKLCFDDNAPQSLLDLFTSYRSVK